MVQKSKGPRKRTRALLRGEAREKLIITKYIKEFKMGSRVVIKPDSSSNKGRPFKRFFGKTGIVTNKRGKSYIIKIIDGKKEKCIITRPEHLKAI